MCNRSRVADRASSFSRYYVGHRGKFGHEFLEFEFRPDGKASLSRFARPSIQEEVLNRLLLLSTQLRYANNSNYKNDTLIKKEAFVSAGILSELKRIIADSEAGSLREP